MRDGTVVLGPGDVFTVPRGVEHFPHADPGTRILMFEPAGTATTGDEHGDIAHLRTSHGIALDPAPRRPDRRMLPGDVAADVARPRAACAAARHPHRRSTLVATRPEVVAGCAAKLATSAPAVPWSSGSA